MKKAFLCFILLISCLLVSKNVSAEETLVPNSKAAILMEASTGKVIYENNKNERLPMASMTKVMTLAIIMDSIRDNKIGYSDVLTTSEYAKSMGGSQVYLETGEKHTLLELIKCICISSANDAAVTVAEAIAGTEAKFVSFMNKKALELNMTDTKYNDCTGLSDNDHYTSAYNMAIISRYLLNNYPEILEYTSMKEGYLREDTSNPFWLVNTNKLLGYNSIDGLKTGWTNKAGYCITATSKRNDMRLIGVVMGYSNPKLRNKEVVELLNYGYSNFELKCLVSNGEIIDNIDNIRLKPNNVKLVASKDIYILLGKDESLDNIKVKYNYSIKIEDLISGNIGNVLVYNNEELVEKIDIVTDVTVKKRNYFEVLIKILEGIFKSD